MFVTYILSSS